MNIKDTSIIITGAGAGFGKAMALFFLAKGAKIYAIDVNKEALKQLKTTSNNKIQTFYGDVTDNSQVETIIDEVFNQNKTTNVLINNAGIMKNAPLVNLLQRPDGRHTIDLWDKVVQVNQNAVFYMARSFATKMVKNRNKGVIINISSIAERGNIGQTAYAATKAAVVAMSKVWAKELGIFGIRSAAIAPGFINTVGAHDALEEKMLAKWVDKTPLKRTGEISEVVSAVQFIIENDFFNGEVLHVNGGLVL